MSLWIEDEDRGIETQYWVYLEGVSLEFDSRLTGSEVEIFKKYQVSKRGETEMCRKYDCPRSLVWGPSAPCFVDEDEDIHVLCTQCDGGPPHTGVIAGWEDVAALAQGAKYQGGISRLEINGEFGFGASTVSLMVRKTSLYFRAQSFKLSVAIENIHRDEWNNLLKYQQCMQRYDLIVDNAHFAWRGNERVIEQMPKSPWQDDRSDVTKDMRHIARESMALASKYLYAQSVAIQRGLCWDDFQWESPNILEARVLRSPSNQTDTPLRALRLDISLMLTVSIYNEEASLFILDIELTLTSITRSPSLPNALSSCTIRLDAHYATLANATIPDYSSQIIEVSTDSQSTERVISTNGLKQTITVNVVRVMGSVTGDIYGAPIHGGNVGGRNNINNITTQTPDTPSGRKGGVSLIRRFEFLPGLRAIFPSAKRREGEARVQEGAAYNE